MRKFTPIVFLFIGSICKATDNYYVATDGNDSYTEAQAQNPATPWRTLTKAFNTPHSNDYIINLAAGTYDNEPSYIMLGSSKNGANITVNGATSDPNETILDTKATYCFFISSWTSGSLTFNNMTFLSTYEGFRRLLAMAGSYDGVPITFDHCILGDVDDATAGYVQCVYYANSVTEPPTRVLTFQNSYCYGKGNVDIIFIEDVNTLTIDNTVVDVTNYTTFSKSAIRLRYSIGAVTVNNGSTINSGNWGIMTDEVTSFNSCEIKNVTFDCNNQIFMCTDCLQNGIFANITGNGGIILGHVYEYCYHPLGQIIVQDCNLVHTSPDVNAGVFGLVLGYGVTGAEVSNNKFLNFAIALSLKGTACNIHHNIFKGGSNSPSFDYYPVYIRSAKYCLFENNTVYALGRFALYLYDQSGGFPPDPDTDYNVFVNNIIDASGGGTYAFYLRGPNTVHNLFDYNCYVAGSKALGHGRYEEGDLTTLLELKNWWAANGGSEESRANESHSIDTSPLFANPANNDFHLKSQAGRWDPNSQSWVKDANTSPCIDAGDPNSEWTLELWPHGKRINIGAYGGTPQASMSLSDDGKIADLDNDDYVDYNDIELLVEKWLYQQVLLPEDLDRNGIVNFLDFAEFANHWLEGPIP